MNKVIMIGNLTKAPECGKTPNGVNYARFTIAVNRDYKNSEGKKIADFFSIVAWRGLADLCYKYLVKGSKVSVIGTIENRTYENKDKQKVNTYDIVADEVEFLISNNKKGASNEQPTSETMP